MMDTKQIRKIRAKWEQGRERAGEMMIGDKVVCGHDCRGDNDIDVPSKVKIEVRWRN